MDAIIPIKSLIFAKTRLAHMLSADERYGLALTMLGDVLGSLRASAQIERIYLVGRDPDARSLAQLYQAEWLFDTTRDLNSAMRLGARQAYEHGSRHILLLHADLPLINAGDIEQLANVSEQAQQIGLAPARDGGTHALASRTPLPIPLAFGRRSMLMHLEAAVRRGLRAQLVRSPTLRDIDQPEDLIWLLEQRGASRAQGFIQQLNLFERVASA